MCGSFKLSPMFASLVDVKIFGRPIFDIGLHIRPFNCVCVCVCVCVCRCMSYHLVLDSYPDPTLSLEETKLLCNNY